MDTLKLIVDHKKYELDQCKEKVINADKDHVLKLMPEVINAYNDVIYYQDELIKSLTTELIAIETVLEYNDELAAGTKD